MHIPPGFLGLQFWIPMVEIATAGVAQALKKTGREINERRAPVMEEITAFIFAAHMDNFPVWGNIRSSYRFCTGRGDIRYMDNTDRTL